VPLLAGLLALAALGLLPGLLVVRAPWTAVVPLSLGFWVLSAWWPPLAGLGRTRVVWTGLLVFSCLSLLRLLPKHAVEPPPGWPRPPAPPPPPRPGPPPPALASAPSLLVLGAALALLLPVPLWRHAPGPRLAFQTTIARVLLWRDAVPATAEPLLPLSPVGAHAPALATLAADVSRLSGLDPAPSLLLVVVGAAGLLVSGLFALHATWAPSSAAAFGALFGLAAMPWPGALSAWGEGEALVALAFVLPAAALLRGRSSRSSAVAAGMLFAAGALAHPLLAAFVWLGTTGVAAARGRAVGRMAVAAGLSLVLAGPGLSPLVRTVSVREAIAVWTAIRPAAIAAFTFGLAVAFLAPLAGIRLARGRAFGRRTLAAGCALCASLLVVRVHGWIASGQVPDATRRALERAAAATSPCEPVCAPDGARDWVPALAARAAGEPGPWIPPVYADEWAARPRRHCSARLGASAPGP